MKMSDMLCSAVLDYAQRLFPKGVGIAAVFWVEGEAQDPDSIGVGTAKGSGPEAVSALRLAADKMEADLKARGEMQ